MTGIILIKMATCCILTNVCMIISKMFDFSFFPFLPIPFKVSARVICFPKSLLMHISQTQLLYKQVNYRNVVLLLCGTLQVALKPCKMNMQKGRSTNFLFVWHLVHNIPIDQNCWLTHPNEELASLFCSKRWKKLLMNLNVICSSLFSAFLRFA